MEKYVYLFQEGNKDMKNLLGGKGANLAEMTNIGMPVPSGFTVTTEACNKYYKDGKELSSEVIDQIKEALEKLEAKSGKKFGDLENPLLVSVRSGARASMPGMMDTVLNLGLNDDIAASFSEKIGNKRFVYDSYRRFIQMFADVVKGYSKSKFETIIDEVKTKKGVKNDIELDENDMVQLTSLFKKAYKEFAGEDFPQDPIVQLIEAVKAVFRSWNNERAIYYRRINDIPSSWGTAVNVQEMVYGNSGENSGTGVAFTRNPATGEKALFGEYLINAQGEDVVAGIRTPSPIATLKEEMPEVYKEFASIAQELEKHYKDMQDMEFTIENGKLFILQTRNGKRTARAAVKVAVDLVNEKMISKEEAVLMVEPKQLDALLHPTFTTQSLKSGKVVARGLAASPGAGTGKIYFNAADVIENKKKGIDSLLVRLETSPEDIEGMNSSKGVLTIRGGMTSHAAVVARGMGICCVSGASSIVINEEEKTLKMPDGTIYKEGDYLSIDGSTGNVYAGKLEMQDASISGDFETFMSWADDARVLRVRTNADTPKDAIQARKFGAEGIGLCRTEHMFFERDRIFNFRKMICATTLEEREKALENILPYQRKDFEGLYEAMAPYSVVIRYLDPPLHEFLPKTDAEIKELAKDLGKTTEELYEVIDSLKEFNPMMGHRGCRLAITYPEIARMQTRAVIEAAINVSKKGIDVTPEIMIPLVGEVKELKYVKNIVCQTADVIIKESGIDLKYEVGTMIEIPRAALLADKIAEEAEFFSFGTNDLTQMTYGFSRDDAGKFLNSYYEKGIFEFDPFARIDFDGVGLLMQMGATKGRSVNKDLSLGICGEHGGDPASVEFCHKLGFNYVSCSPFRVPIARLAAAQAAIKSGDRK
ncbi:pyruvate phosphate dikinase [Clostridium sp. CAG:609]|nr:pyruvate phosphate dikinase [Clostridium sp. CAG:609]